VVEVTVTPPRSQLIRPDPPVLAGEIADMLVADEIIRARGQQPARHIALIAVDRLDQDRAGIIAMHAVGAERDLQVCGRLDQDRAAQRPALGIADPAPKPLAGLSYGTSRHGCP
jgi:hypothetical protein